MQKTANQNIMPMTAQVNSENHLEIGGCDTVELADKYGTPLYVMDETTIRTIATQYKEAFSSYTNIKMLFASKALMTKAIAKILVQEGFGFDVVSGGEIYTAINAGAKAETLLFNGSNKTFDGN